MKRYCKTDNDIFRTSYKISEPIAKKLKSYTEEEFMKKCVATAAKLLAPDKVTLFQNVSLSRRTVSDRIQEMGDVIEKNNEGQSSIFQFFAQALDETADVANKAQAVIFIQGVNSNFNLQEDLLSVKTMHETTGDEDLFEKLLLAMCNFNLPFEK